MLESLSGPVDALRGSTTKPWTCATRDIAKALDIALA